MAHTLLSPFLKIVGQGASAALGTTATTKQAGQAVPPGSTPFLPLPSTCRGRTQRFFRAWRPVGVRGGGLGRGGVGK